jgi:hypothetical protein
MDSCLERTLAEIQRAAGGMSPEQLAWHPVDKWSTAQILEHLSLAFAGTAKGMDRAMTAGIVSPKRTIKDRLAVLVVVRCGYMPSGRQAPKGTVPGPGDPQNILATIVANLTAMDAALTRVENAMGRKVLLQHPILGPLTIAQWRKFHWVHTAHHMKQIVHLKQVQRNGAQPLAAVSSSRSK